MRRTSMTSNSSKRKLGEERKLYVITWDIFIRSIVMMKVVYLIYLSISIDSI